VHVHEPRGDDLAARVDLAPALLPDGAHGRDPVPVDRDVGPRRGRAGAVGHLAAADHDVVHGGAALP
jgi:hypothetical protein